MTRVGDFWKVSWFTVLMLLPLFCHCNRASAKTILFVKRERLMTSGVGWVKAGLEETIQSWAPDCSFALEQGMLPPTHQLSVLGSRRQKWFVGPLFYPSSRGAGAGRCVYVKGTDFILLLMPAAAGQERNGWYISLLQPLLVLQTKQQNKPEY